MDLSLVASDFQEMMTKKKATPKRKSSDQKKNQPLKVVYISNPMWVYTSASEFRALVQELTGRDAEFPDPSKFPSASIDIRETNVQKKQEVNDDDDDDELLLDLSAIDDSSDDFLSGSYESLEDIFMRDMMETLAATSRSVEASGLVIGV